MHKCIDCNNKLVKKFGNRKEFIDNKYIDIDNVPYLQCEECREIYFEPYVEEKINNFILNNIETNIASIDFKSL